MRQAPPLTVEVIPATGDPAPAIRAWAALLLALVAADANHGDGD